MATTPARPRLQVRGQCPTCQRKVTRFAPPGKATVKIGCPRQGCEATFTLRRVDDKTAAKPEEQPEPAAPAPAGKKSTVERVRGYQRDPGDDARPAPKLERQKQPEHLDAGGGSDESGDDAGGGSGGRPVRAGRPETGHKRHPYADLGYNW